jgi:CheY-like chemotaxis protein
METRLRILHLEDSPEDAELVQMALAHAGIPHNVKAVATKEDFIAALAGPPFDVILSDGNVGEFDGATALTLVREQDPQIPFFFVSGSMPTDARVKELKEAGAVDVISKWELGSLVNSILETIHGHERIGSDLGKGGVI